SEQPSIRAAAGAACREVQQGGEDSRTGGGSECDGCGLQRVGVRQLRLGGRALRQRPFVGAPRSARSTALFRAIGRLPESTASFRAVGRLPESTASFRAVGRCVGGSSWGSCAPGTAHTKPTGTYSRRSPGRASDTPPDRLRADVSSSPFPATPTLHPFAAAISRLIAAIVPA